ncbi:MULTISPECIES: tetratricopeptide repeat protein [unclassified Microcoleus]|uniref:tetratricopeptide repeat protein n=1 Tax=unclassified Microcoleus TaxID=2642155 RepID=UPI002FD5A94B
MSNVDKLQVQGQPDEEINRLIKLASDTKLVGKYQEATKYYLQILEIAFQIGNEPTKILAVAGLGSIMICCQQYELAIEYYHSQLKTAKNINHKSWEADALCNLGYTDHLLKNYDAAIEYQKTSLKIASEIESKEIQAKASSYLGIIYHELGQYTEAIEYYNKSLAIYSDMGLQHEEAEALASLGMAERELTKSSQYLETLTRVNIENVFQRLYKALFVCQNIGNPVLEAKIFKEFAKTYELIGEMELAKNYCEKAIKFATELKLPLLIECQDLINKYNTQQEDYEYKLEAQHWYKPDFPQSQVIDQKQLQAIQDSIDVVIMTATGIELTAILHLLTPYPRRKAILRYFGENIYYIGKCGLYNTVVTKCRMGAIGEGAATIATYEALNRKPRAIIMVGIAFGKDATKQKIGDVLVASEIIFYEKERVGPNENVSRSPIPPSSRTLLDRFENAHGWNFTYPDNSQRQPIVGSILSGEKLVDNSDFKATLFERFPEAIGGEM